MRKLNYSEFEKIVCHASSNSSLFDFVALHSCAISRELLYLRLRQMLIVENCSISFIFCVCLNSKGDFSVSDYAILLRFLRAYWNIGQADYSSFLQSFNDYYHCSLQESDFYTKTREIF